MPIPLFPHFQYNSPPLIKPLESKATCLQLSDAKAPRIKGHPSLQISDAKAPRIKGHPSLQISDALK